MKESEGRKERRKSRMDGRKKREKEETRGMCGLEGGGKDGLTGCGVRCPC